MKKILTVLLILAVSAGALFAQDAEAPAAGTFTWTGEFRFGTDVDFIPSDLDDPVMKGSNGYGQATMSYDKGALNTELTFRTNKLLPTPSGYITGFAEYGDGVNGTEESNFKVAGKLKILDSGSPAGALPFETLYGYYFFLDRQLKLDVAYHGYETIYWRASDVVAQAWDNLEGKPGVALNYTPAFLSGLSVGAMLPRLDKTADAAGNSLQLADNYFQQTVFGAKYTIPDVLAVSTMVRLAPKDSKAERAQLGFKYTVIPDSLSVKADATAFNLGDFGKTGIINAGLNAEYQNGATPTIIGGLTLKLAGVPGAYQDSYNANLTEARRAWIAGKQEQFDDHMKAFNPPGANKTPEEIAEETENWLRGKGTKPISWDNSGNAVDYGPKFATVAAWAADDAPAGPPADPGATDPYYYKAEGLGIGSDNDKSTPAFFYLNPYVYYNIIPDTLQVRLPVTLAFGISDAAFAKNQKFLLVEPGIYLNTKKDGAGDDPGSGILAKYSIGYDLENSEVLQSKLSINFRWSF
ncbi:hypothetical protein FACS189461_3350 [Spirochaetia bacterium]|nr:hypothetical protein FACS189461_3350 [Spirochaetia bacterium]